MAKFREGDLFAIALPEKDWVTGRILLDVDRVLKKLGGASTPFRVRKGTILVEVYKQATSEPSTEVSAPLIPSAWIDPDAILGRDKPKWPIVGNVPVDGRTVDFPENVFGVTGDAKFEKGEISLPIHATTADVERWEVRTTAQLPSRFARICSQYLGRPQHADPNMFSLADSDLRYNPHRPEVFARLGADPQRSYFDWATSLGLDPARLWS